MGFLVVVLIVDDLDVVENDAPGNDVFAILDFVLFDFVLCGIFGDSIFPLLGVDALAAAVIRGIVLRRAR